MRLYELECSHGIGHSSGVHGCDGCCAMLTKPATEAERERIINLLEEHTYYGQDGWLELSDKALTRADLEALIKGEQK
jgi:hypothetical protein